MMHATPRLVRAWRSERTSRRSRGRWSSGNVSAAWAALALGVAAFAPAGGQAPSPTVPWKDCLEQPPAWYGSAEAARIADNLIVYQRRSGGWPKNVDMAQPLTPAGRATVIDEKDLNDSTIDNSSTYTQIRFLGRVVDAAHLERHKAAFISGLDYLLTAQYPSGGWPQYFPLRANYSRYITFNDNAMIGVMLLLGDIAGGEPPFTFVDRGRRARAGAAVERGLRLILRSQIKVGGRLTAWCAQVDPVTFEPRGARTYEPPSTSGKESVDIVRYLMSIPHPAAEVVAAVEGAIAFYRANQVTGLRVVSVPDPALPHGRDVVAQEDPGAPPLWARFYEIGTNRPMYLGRDGIVKYRLADIEAERRAGYSWLGPYAADLLEKDYPAWKQRLK
jgi:PelA/Pel-15E family pectate lyase